MTHEPKMTGLILLGAKLAVKSGYCGTLLIFR